MAEEILQFVPFTSFVNASFWHKLAELKMDVDRLDDLPRSIFGFFSNTDTNGAPGKCLLEVDYTAFNSDFVEPYRSITSHGRIYNKNTIEEFRGCDKNMLMHAEGNRVIAAIKSGEWIETPNLLNRFLVISYADLKSFDFYYCFGYPAPMYGNVTQMHCDAVDVAALNEAIGDQQVDLSFCAFKWDEETKKYSHLPLSQLISNTDTGENLQTEDLSKLFFAFSDPSTNEKPGWPLRVYLAALLHSCPRLINQEIKTIALRGSRRTRLSESKLFRIRLPDAFSIDTVQWLGWELNSKGKFAPKLSAMGASMDPHKLAETSTYLNLKLMKWRLMPTLNLEAIAKQKCLLLGAGTLGCGVARNLLSWGVRNITFVDSGKVSYSNPVRQNLYRHEDALHGRPKAKTAAERIIEICPSATAKGVSIHIPMPGHTVSPALISECKGQFDAIEALVKEHDVLFLLTDSRESRWLPTVLGAAHGKLVMNSALGFDSYLVMRHGANGGEGVADAVEAVAGFKSVPGDQLGCYFCNDIVAPGNSLKDRTLDQQCTVTRPAVSNIAASLVVELLVSLTQHSLGGSAPAYIRDFRGNGEDIPEGLLGVIPHSIRGSIATFDQIMPATERFSKCIACSQVVLNAFKEEGFELALKAFNSSRFLEDLTGITELLHGQQDLLECGDVGEFEMSD